MNGYQIKLITNPLFIITFIVACNLLGAIVNDSSLGSVAFLHILGLLTGYFLAKKSPIQKVKNNVDKSIFRFVVFSESILLYISVIVVVYLLFKAKASPLDYIININYYRLSINKDVGYAKFFLNIWMIFSTWVFLESKEGALRYLIIPGLVNIFFGYRFSFAIALFSVFFQILLFKKSTFKYILTAIFIFLAFGLFAFWRDLRYQGASVENLLSLMTDLSEDGLFFAILNHGFLAHFVTFQNLSSAIDFVNDTSYAFHYGIEYFFQILRLIKFDYFFYIPASVDLSFNAYLRGKEVIDLIGQDAGGVVIGLPGSLFIAGSTAFVILGSAIWAYIVTRMTLVINFNAESRNLVLFPYYLLIYQSPETNIPRLFLIYFSLFLFLVISELIISSK